jgi:two-component system response regulator PilR (NtrC family)
LAEHFLKRANARIGKAIAGISDDAMELLAGYDWPGNVRELENVIERAVALETTPVIHAESLPDTLKIVKERRERFGSVSSFDELPEEGIHFHDHVAGVEKRLLRMALEQSGGVQTRAARLLHMSLRSFRYLIQKYELR